MAGEIQRYSGKTIAVAGTAIVTVLVIASMWIFGWGFVQRSTAEWRGETEERERTVADGSYRIAAYEWFFDQCAAVQNQEATLAALRTELESEPSQGRVEQINATITAVTANRSGLINEYNAEAGKEATAAQFHASNLPAELNPNEETTTCVAPSE